MFLSQKAAQTVGKTVSARVDFANAGKGVVTQEKSRNAVVKDGCLTAAKGVVALNETDVFAAFECALGTLLCKNDGVYLKTADALKKIHTCVFASPSFLYAAKQKKLLVSEKGKGTFVFDGENFQQVFEKGFSTLALCKERVFGADGALYFCERDDFSSWNGKLQLSQPVAVTESGDLWAVGNDLFKIDFSDCLQNTKVIPVYKNVGKVYEKTISVFGNKMFFLTDGGLMCYSANKTEKIAEDVNFSAENFCAVGQVYRGKYFLSASEKGGSNDLLLCVDCKSCKTLCVWDVKADFLTSCDRLLWTHNGKLFTFGDGFADVFWQSKSFDFGNAYAKKYLRKLLVDTEYPLDVHVVTEKDRKIYRFDGSSFPQQLNICGYFCKLRLELFSQGATKVNDVCVLAQTY